MPTYVNGGTSTVYVDDPPLKLAAGATVALAYYLKDIPTGVTKSLDTPLAQPWDLLATASSFPGDSIDVHSWDAITIYNAADGVITFSANGDDANAMVILASTKHTFDNSNGLLGSIKILTNAGTGNVYVYGETS
jgi:hypothetical protein